VRGSSGRRGVRDAESAAKERKGTGETSEKEDEVQEPERLMLLPAREAKERGAGP
jgi:hypothetical protein